jgi:hypothetical protein
MRSALISAAVWAMSACTLPKDPPVVDRPGEELPAPGEQLPGKVEPPQAPVLAPSSGAPRVDWVEEPPPLSTSTKLLLEPETGTRVSEVSAVEVNLEVVGTLSASASVEFIGPGQMPYQRQDAELSGSAFDSQSHTFRMLVAGTDVEAHGLSGTWEARIFLDGEEIGRKIFELGE